MLAGKGFHRAIEIGMKAVLGGRDITVEECVNPAIHEVMEEYQAVGMDLPPEQSMLVDPAEVLDGVLTRIRRAASWWLTERIGAMRPAQVEHRFEVPLPGTDWLITGQIDVIEDDGSIRDHKLSNSKNPPALDIADHSVQLGVYATVRWLETGQVPPYLFLDYTRDLSRIGTIERIGRRSVQDCERWLDRIRHVCHTIDRGSFAPASPEGIECRQGRCSLWSHCRYGGGQSEPQ